MPLVALNFSFEHGDAASSLDQVIFPASPVQHLSLDEECPLTVSASLMEIALINDAVLVFANAPALLEPFQHLSFETHLPQLPFRYHFQNKSSCDSSLFNGCLVFLLGLSC